MKAIKKKISACLLLACALASCIDEQEAPRAELERDVLLTISVQKPPTRSVGGAAEGVEPEIERVWGFFLHDGVVWAAQQQPLTGGEATFTDIPNYVSEIAVIGYPEGSDSPAIASPENIATKAQLMQTLVDLAAQQADNPARVNTYGSAAVNFLYVKKGQTAEATVEVTPVVSRLEILRVHPADPPSTMTLKKPVETFCLEAIYINNTYRKAGLDRRTADAPVAFGGSDVGPASPWGNLALYTPGFCDPVCGIGGSGSVAASYAPEAGRWNYYAASLSAEAAGTTINGEAQDALPHIILRLSNIKPAGVAAVIPGPMFLTIRKYRDTASGQDIREFLPGKAYVVTNIAFGLEHLSILPETDPTEYTLELSVADWTDVTIERDL